MFIDLSTCSVGHVLTLVETLFDLLELYTHNRGSTCVGPQFPSDTFLKVRIPLNQEAEAQGLPRFTNWTNDRAPKAPNGFKITSSNSNKPPGATENGDSRIHPLIPVAANGERPKAGERGRDGAVRFMIDPECANNEKSHVAQFFKVEMEEYEVEE